MLIGIPPNLSVSKAVRFLKREAFSQDADGVSEAEKEVRGPAFVGEGLLAGGAFTSRLFLSFGKELLVAQCSGFDIGL